MAIMDEEELQDLYQWVDSIPLSRPKRNIARDFADGMLVAEVVKHFFPKLVELHNYPAAHSVQQKKYNWRTLSQKVFRKLAFDVEESEIESIVTCVPGAIERFLRALQTKVQQIQQKKLQRQQESAHEAEAAAAGHPGRSPSGASSGGAPIPYLAGGGAAGGAAHHGHVGHAGHQGHPGHPGMSMHQQIIEEKDEIIAEMKETIEILDMKVMKLEKLLQLKDSKIQVQAGKLQQYGIKV